MVLKKKGSKYSKTFLAQPYKGDTLQKKQKKNKKVSLEIISTYLTYWSLLVNWFDDKFLVVERDVTNFTPWETYLWCQFVVLFINIQSQCIHTQKKFCSFLVFDFEIIDTIHLKILSNLQIF